MTLNTQQFWNHFELIIISVGQLNLIQARPSFGNGFNIADAAETSIKATQYWAYRPIGDCIRWLYTPCVAIDLTVWYAPTGRLSLVYIQFIIYCWSVRFMAFFVVDWTLWQRVRFTQLQCRADDALCPHTAITAIVHHINKIEMCGNGLQHSHSVPFPSVHSHFQSHSHDASDLVTIPAPLPTFIPILSLSHQLISIPNPIPI